MAHAKSAASLVLLFVACALAQSRPWDDLRVTFSFGGIDDGFFQLPRTLAEAAAKNWSEPAEDVASTLKVQCPESDPVVCVLYDRTTGDVNGLQFGYLVTDAGSPYNMSAHPIYQKTTRFGYEIYVATIYTVKPVSAVDSQLETGDGVWFAQGPQGVANFEVPRLAAGMDDTLFTLQSCVPGMGVHYYYNISRELPCEQFEPMFALFDAGEMIGVGLQTWGIPTQLGSRPWFEPVPAAAIRPTVPNCPQCMVDWTAEYKLISLHIYFVDQPWTIAC